MYNEQIWTLPVLTHVVDDEAFALAENEPGRVRVEGDSQIGRGGEELERAAAANVPPQYASGELLAICDGYHVAVADVQPGQGDTERVRKCKSAMYGILWWIYPWVMSINGTLKIKINSLSVAKYPFYYILRHATDLSGSY